MANKEATWEKNDKTRENGIGDTKACKLEY